MNNPPDEPSIDISKVKWKRTAPGVVENETPIVVPVEPLVIVPLEIVQMAKDIRESVNRILAMSDEELMGEEDIVDD